MARLPSRTALRRFPRPDRTTCVGLATFAATTLVLLAAAGAVPFA